MRNQRVKTFYGPGSAKGTVDSLQEINPELFKKKNVVLTETEVFWLLF